MLAPLQADLIDVAYPPLFQSGGEYDFKLSATSNNKAMHYGVIICSVGARYVGPDFIFRLAFLGHLAPCAAGAAEDIIPESPCLQVLVLLRHRWTHAVCGP